MLTLTPSPNIQWLTNPRLGAAARLGHTASIAIAGLSLAACDHSPVQAHAWDTAKAEQAFMSCMNATPPASEPADLENKISACQQAAWASSRRAGE